MSHLIKKLFIATLLSAGLTLFTTSIHADDYNTMTYSDMKVVAIDNKNDIVTFQHNNDSDNFQDIRNVPMPIKNELLPALKDNTQHQTKIRYKVIVGNNNEYISINRTADAKSWIDKSIDNFKTEDSKPENKFNDEDTAMILVTILVSANVIGFTTLTGFWVKNLGEKKSK